VRVLTKRRLRRSAAAARLALALRALNREAREFRRLLAAGCPATAAADPGTAGEPGERVEASWGLLAGRKAVAR